jgi:hypothetical protein
MGFSMSFVISVQISGFIGHGYSASQDKGDSPGERLHAASETDKICTIIEHGIFLTIPYL